MKLQKVFINKRVFRAYDIRGIVAKELAENEFYTLGLALGLELKSIQRESAFIARDGRLTSLALSTALGEGLMAQGINIVDLGAVTTPMLYFATHTENIDSGFIVTGSHNPSEYNGLKMVLAQKTLVHTDIERIYKLVVALQNDSKEHCARGKYTCKDIFYSYKKRILGDIKLQRPLKVVVDCGHGIASPFVPDVLTALGCEVIPLYCNVDGNFPVHHPDPTVEANLLDLRQAVLLNQADIGLGFDGDGDRLGVLHEKGEIIWPDRLIMYYIQDILPRYQGAKIVFDVKCSKKLIDKIRELGGQPLMCPTGHSIVKSIMREENAPLAGEMSGHLFFKDRWFGFDDALYSACRLLELISQHNESVSEQFLNIPLFPSTPELKIPVEDEQKFELIKRFSDEIMLTDADVISIDGVRIEFANGWGLLRASNTTPCLVARFEADSTEALQSIQTFFKDTLLKLSAELILPF